MPILVCGSLSFVSLNYYILFSIRVDYVHALLSSPQTCRTFLYMPHSAGQSSLVSQNLRSCVRAPISAVPLTSRVTLKSYSASVYLPHLSNEGKSDTFSLSCCEA